MEYFILYYIYDETLILLYLLKKIHMKTYQLHFEFGNLTWISLSSFELNKHFSLRSEYLTGNFRRLKKYPKVTFARIFLCAKLSPTRHLFRVFTRKHITSFRTRNFSFTTFHRKREQYLAYLYMFSSCRKAKEGDPSLW